MNEYSKLYPDDAIPLSESQFDSILKYNALAVSETDRMVTPGELQWEGDSVFRSYGDKRFKLDFSIGNLDPGIHRAGDINYIVQGMLHAHGWNTNRAIMYQNIYFWNTAQGLGFRGGGGWGENIRQIFPAMDWADVGYDYYLKNR